MSGNSTTGKYLVGDIRGGTAAMLVGLPSAIAYGLMSYAPLGSQYSGMAALGSIIGTVAFSLVVPIFRGTKGLISVPSAAAAAVISVFVAELMKGGHVPIQVIPVYITLLTIVSGLIQLGFGNFGGGKFIKYIPYPVITGYLNGVAVLLLLGQLPKLLGLSKGVTLLKGCWNPAAWNPYSLVIGGATISAMLVSRKITKKVPAVVIALGFGILVYLLLAAFNPALFDLKNNPLVIGEIAPSPGEIVRTLHSRYVLMPLVDVDSMIGLIVPGVTLALLLSITTLNTCVVLDGLTFSNHDPRRELMIQGFGNIVAGLTGGIPGSGIMTATMENINNGAKTRTSTFFFGLIMLITVLGVGRYISWIPVPALAGILIVVGIRMIDFKIISMLKNRSTILDFSVIMAVVVAAANLDLIKAAGVGIAMAIFLFLREQMGVSVIRRKVFGNQVFSKKIRVAQERKVLEERGEKTVIIELQGQLFFGTTDQLFSKLEPYYAEKKYIILDMRRIQSVDYTAANMLKKIVARIKEKDGILVFTSVPLTLPTGQNVREYLQNLGLTESSFLKYFDDLDAALLWIEDEILLAEGSSIYSNDKVLDLQELELFEGFNEEAVSTLHECTVTKAYRANEQIFKGGDASDEIYFVRKGNVKIVLSLNDGKQFHLLTIGMGGVFGEMAFIDKITRSADAISVDDTVLYALSRDKFNQVTVRHPHVSGLVFERLALLIANRLRQSNRELKVFQES